MSLESATYINGLVVTNPVGASDPKSKGDDHIRLIKSVLKNTFPNITGQVTVTHGELNNLAGVSGTPIVIPVGTRMFFCQAAAPTGWTQVTLVESRLLRVVSSGAGGGTTGNDECHLMSKVPSHTHDFSTGASGAHTHRVYGSTSVVTENCVGAGATTARAMAGTSSSEGLAYYTTFGASGANMLEAAASHVHSGTVDANGSAENWRPYILDVILAEKA